jgi:hypothetical protein
VPATSEKQRRYFGAELARKRAGQKTDTGMTESQLEDFASAIVKPKRPPQPRKPRPTQPTATTDKEPWER